MFCQKFERQSVDHIILIAGLVILLILSSATQLYATEIKLIKGESAVVAAVIDGDTVRLAHAVGDGNLVSDQIRLVGIQAPKLPLGRKNFKTWPLADKAKAALEKLSLGKTVSLSYGGRRMDRHGRLLAHLHLPDGTWIQGELLATGMARVYSFPDNRAVIPEMLAQENYARQNQLGIWRHTFYRIRKHSDLMINLPRYKNSFQLVEGRVLEVARIRKKVFVNFGANWRTDFTVTLDSRAIKLFDRAGFDPLLLKGKNVRVRGWVKSFNGPNIAATHPEQIEMLGK